MQARLVAGLVCYRERVVYGNTTIAHYCAQLLTCKSHFKRRLKHRVKPYLTARLSPSQRESCGFIRKMMKKTIVGVLRFCLFSGNIKEFRVRRLLKWPGMRANFGPPDTGLVIRAGLTREAISPAASQGTRGVFPKVRVFR
ncbi:hypothetical protein ALP44_200185 [Pseudomonas syringae pv. theae]|uniref:Uncharacterized protein n=1 Tax=Pseudomonas syringae pv. theae TaxID=103985 RepID=A0A3M5MLP5_PSESX|nr:hypothetical protein ALP44_200185 [Pseudomonas syringae pv. theae]